MHSTIDQQHVQDYINVSTSLNGTGYKPAIK